MSGELGEAGEDTVKVQLAWLMALFNKPGEFFSGEYIAEKVMRALLHPESIEKGAGLDGANKKRFEIFLGKLNE